MKSVFAIRHVHFEDLGAFESVFGERGYQIHYHDAGACDLACVDALAADIVVILGAPIGANEEDKYPFLVEELRIIDRRIEAKRPTLGICLGAQLMARALGASVYPGTAKEIGWSMLALTREGRSSPLNPFDQAPVLHWHGDTFSLPKGALRLASTAITENQAFEFGPTALAIQFHPEAEPEGFERWLVGHACEVTAAGVSVSELRSSMRQFGVSSALRGRACLTQWLARLYSSPGSTPKNRQDLQASYSNP
jgi:GMP synthase (glutamine-hydrolysing)